MNTSNYIKLPLSSDKQHFVVGDIHGRFETFCELLEQIKYHKDTHIIYSVGDLIDRGPDSVDVIKFFQQPNTYAALGNHEQMLVNITDWENVWLGNGGLSTLADLKNHNLSLRWLTNFCKTLPICIDVGENNDTNAFRIIHAEIPETMSDEDFRTYLMEFPDDAPEGQLLWGRKIISKALNNLNNNLPIDHNIIFEHDCSTRQLFVGHTPIQKIMKLKHMWYIDTYASNSMSMVNAITHETFTAPVTHYTG